MIEIIPAIDVMDGKCVRLQQGDFGSKKVYADDPLSVALQFQDAGLKRLHMVDLDGAKGGSIVNRPTLERVAAGTDLIIDFGGGIKDEKCLSEINSGLVSLVSAHSCS